MKSVDIIEELLYSNSYGNIAPNSRYEEYLFEIMLFEDVSFLEALQQDIFGRAEDYDTVFGVVEFLESQVNDLIKVDFLMGIYTGKIPDFKLTNF
jgi:hypothetical protein